ncbi:MAG: hypothetical protein QM756_28575 [Polyangiaceae bacterium]
MADDVTRDDDAPHLELAADLRGFFQPALATALSERRVSASEPTSHYLVALLVDFAHPAALSHEMERPLAVQLAEALDAVGSERFERLRCLGDNVLYTSGFFLDHLETHGVELSYVSSLGARAYGTAASMLRRAGGGDETPRAPELFEELADKFAPFAEVLATLADGLFANSAKGSDSGSLKMYERWLRSGSPKLASALAERGMAPTRGRGGLH